MENRYYQNEAEAAVCTNYDAGVYQQLLSMATGTGKTVVISNLYKKLQDRLPKQMMILAHREELIDQAISTMHEAHPGLKIDKEKAHHKADPSTADVIVASVQTLGRAGSKRILNYNWENFDKMVTDEAHHSAAKTYLNIYEAAGILDHNSKRLLLGVTATPTRTDGEGLGKVYKKIVYEYSIRRAMKDGFLVPLKAFRVKTNVDLSGVKETEGDFVAAQLAAAVNTPQNNALIVHHWHMKAIGRKTVAFCVDIQHAQDLASVFKEDGVKAEAIWGDDPDRAEKIAAHKAGEITVLCNCGVLTEGYDDPSIECILLRRPTMSAVLFVQMVGRGLRLSPGKTDCIVIDFCDNHNGLRTVPSIMGLPANLDLEGKSLLEATEEYEKVLEENPLIDFSTLNSLATVSSFIEQVDLYKVDYPHEIQAYTNNIWTRNTVGYRLRLPEKYTGGLYLGGADLVIYQNMLDQWEIKGNIKGRDVQGIRSTVEEAFAVADEALTKRLPAEGVKQLSRGTKWRTQKASKEQWDFLFKLYPGKTDWPSFLTKEQASYWIDKRLNKSKKGGK
jgi:ATP-dependent helicase IRC3